MVATTKPGDAAGGGGSRVSCREAGDAYRWFIDGAISVDISFDAIRQIELDWQSKGQMCTGHEEAGGILRGDRAGVSDKVVRIHGVESYCSTGLHHVLGMRKQRPLAGAGEAVGFYRVDVTGRGFSPRDTTIMNEKFTETDSIGLIIQGNSTAMMLVRTEHGLGVAEVDFPLRIAGPERLYPPITPVLADSEPRTRGMFSWKWLALGACCAGLLGVAWSYLPGRRVKDATQPSSPKALGLSAAVQGKSVQFLWNRQSAAVLQASAGTLSVADGQLQTTTHLTPEELAQGAFWYFPESPNVRGKLEVVRQDGQRLSEAVVVLASQTNFPASGSVGPLPKPTNLPPPPTKPAPVKTMPLAPPRPFVLAAAPPAEPNRNIELPDAPPVALPSKVSDPPIAVQGVGALSAPAAPSVATPLRTAGIKPATATIYPRPIVPSQVKAMISRQIDVQVRLQIDEDGNVVAARESHPGGSLAQTLGRIAVDTARLWRFEPARQDGRPVASVMTIQFTFGPQK